MCNLLYNVDMKHQSLGRVCLVGLNIRVEESMIIFDIFGDIDHHTCENIREKIDNSIIEKNLKNIIIDMRKIDFMDSSGIGLVMGRYRLLNKFEGKLVVVSANEKIN
jgi:stage II sporulation protein AA (anti-sigma F factor antagonist)